MIIDHLSTFPHGGAGTAARRLHERLVERGVCSRFNYWKDESDQQFDNSFHQLTLDHTDQSLPILKPLARKLEKRRRRMICECYDRHVADRPEKYELYSIPWTLDKSSLDVTALGSDVIHLHWMAFFIDYPSFFRSIPDAMPIVWSLHDMNPLTGGCHYSSGCSRFTVGCGNCPQLQHPEPRDASHAGFRAKQRALKRKRIHVVTPNAWLSNLAQNSPIFPDQTRFSVIRLGLDEQAFRPVDQQKARQELGLPADVPLVAFGADDIENYRKGFHHLLDALRHIQQQSEVQCLVFGRGNLPTDRSGLPKFHEFGFVDSPERHRLIYSAADVFVLPSREDNQPQTGLESMACGTPVVGFRAGGIPEYVRHEETGLLAGMGNEREMAECIMHLINYPLQRRQLGQAARQMIEHEFTAELQARNYIELYRELANISTPLELPELRSLPAVA